MILLYFLSKNACDMTIEGGEETKKEKASNYSSKS
jgi:hypothetical protein